MFLRFDLTKPGCPTISVQAVFAWGNNVSGSWRLMSNEFENLLAWDDRGTFRLDPVPGGAYLECFDRYSLSPPATYGGKVQEYSLGGIRFVLSDCPLGPDDDDRKSGELDILGSRNPAGWTGRPYKSSNGQSCPTTNRATWTRVR